ncbi:MAG: GntR family transcriptional regulator [Cryomorphaceae bacterium]|nr:GntR family transcriptional regulator [Cryomorphaceae bacterium]
MIQIGKSHTLKASRKTPQGIYLEDETGDSVLLPNAYVPKTLHLGDDMNVFVYLDQEERPVATPHKPLLELGRFSALKVSNITSFGAFFEWGPVKELLVPHDLQAKPIKDEGDKHVVHLMFDDASQRLVGTTKIPAYLLPAPKEEYTPGKTVSALLYSQGDLGYKAVVDQKYDGMIYHSDLFKPVSIGQTLEVFVQKVRPDGKLDLAIEKFGYQKVVSSTDKLLHALKSNDGYLPLHDKSPAEDIYEALKMSKKVFKKAVGALYKKRQIKLEKNGIRLVG